MIDISKLLSMCQQLQYMNFMREYVSLELNMEYFHPNKLDSYHAELWKLYKSCCINPITESYLSSTESTCRCNIERSVYSYLSADHPNWLDLFWMFLSLHCSIFHILKSHDFFLKFSSKIRWWISLTTIYMYCFLVCKLICYLVEVNLVSIPSLISSSLFRTFIRVTFFQLCFLYLYFFILTVSIKYLNEIFSLYRFQWCIDLQRFPGDLEMCFWIWSWN